MTLTARVLCETMSHEGLVREAYLDAVGVWTWGFGITSNSGHGVERYIGKPQTLERCFEVFEWAVRNNYLPAVLDAFDGYDLQEHELAAALSFHWNTGAIHKAEWVKMVLGGEADLAKSFYARSWTNGGLRGLVKRRESERDLFFDKNWAGKTTVLQYSVDDDHRPVKPKPLDISDLVTSSIDKPWPVVVNSRAELSDLVSRELNQLA